MAKKRLPPEDHHSTVRDILRWVLHLEETLDAHQSVANRIDAHNKQPAQNLRHRSLVTLDNTRGRLDQIWREARRQFTKQFFDPEDKLFPYTLRRAVDIVVAHCLAPAGERPLEDLREELVTAGVTVQDGWEPPPVPGDTFDGWVNYAYEVVGSLVDLSGGRVGKIVQEHRPTFVPKPPFGTLSFPGPKTAQDADYIVARVMHILDLDPTRGEN